MDDDLFPSGPWTGFYNYTGPEDRHRMDLDLTFSNGQMAGSGSDNVGPFLIKGRYSAATRECDWVKTYSGSHNVFYRGFRDGHGIWGRWEIPPFDGGGFHIWPRSEGETDTFDETAEIAQPVDAIGVAVTSTPHGSLPTDDFRQALRRSAVPLALCSPNPQQEFFREAPQNSISVFLP